MAAAALQRGIDMTAPVTLFTRSGVDAADNRGGRCQSSQHFTLASYIIWLLACRHRALKAKWLA